VSRQDRITSWRGRSLTASIASMLDDDQIDDHLLHLDAAGENRGQNRRELGP
jgi:hypothetical protein